MIMMTYLELYRNLLLFVFAYVTLNLKASDVSLETASS